MSGAVPKYGKKAAYYPPGVYVRPDDEDLLHGRDLELANTPDFIRHHVIAVYSDIDWGDHIQEGLLAAKLRHEVRHAEQFDACGPQIFHLDQLADEACAWKVGGLPRGATLYGVKPVEMDANTAAAMFLRERRPAAVVQAILETDDDGPLARSNTPCGELRDLPTKMVAFLFQFREILEDPTRSAGYSLEKRLRDIDQHAGELWAQLSRASAPRESASGGEGGGALATGS